VKEERGSRDEGEALIAELSYVISRLHQDMYMFSRADIPLSHEVVVSFCNKNNQMQETVYLHLYKKRGLLRK
jgi:hypothetical protein